MSEKCNTCSGSGFLKATPIYDTEGFRVSFTSNPCPECNKRRTPLSAAMELPEVNALAEALRVALDYVEGCKVNNLPDLGVASRLPFIDDVLKLGDAALAAIKETGMSDFVAGDEPILYKVVNKRLPYITPDKPDDTESRYVEYRRADLPPTLSAAMDMPEVKAMKTALETAARKLKDAADYWDYLCNDAERAPFTIAAKQASEALAAIKELKT